MSATLAVETVSAYLGGCPIITSEGRLHPVEVVYGGQTHASDDALRLGLAEEAVDAARVVERAIERARSFARHPSVAFHHMKAALRDPVLLRIRANHDQHEEEWVDLWFSPQAQARIEEVRAKLLAKKPE